MPNRTRTGALFLLAATGLGAVCAGPAGAVGRTPGFLAARDLPPHPSSVWTAGRVLPGVAEATGHDTCLKDALAGRDDTWHRDFRTDLDAGARQTSVVLPDSGSAEALADRIAREIRSCPARIERHRPDIKAALKDYGRVDVEDGAHLYGLHTDTAWGAQDIRLLSVGRDGRTVTVVDWTQLGGFPDAPVGAFRTTTMTAVGKLR
ncbi:hypothetical protein ELQ87_08360 [Streptomyces griseoviridis]|uniref:Sensor domain-containing protein n=2 Tax=Streptomyces TaxID=1883 RepID=A0A3Q9KRJ8_STRGD|nr:MULTISPECIES: hypothetical protein [Streptomyces]AZS84296.1 hypothetical protein ELQ87_08360 [Streptomyces griseoviridis]MDH6699653.1 hypothetical protein [Streptomyces sp. MAA16]MDT0474914.1 hypothetical protein [Streptomyces sp. DSM 41014]QCN88846.1 hypothetical protein DDJ31_30975 [Streptomyces griseoviridis]